MKKTIIIIFISICFASVLMPGGYGSWEKSIVFSGNVNVEPDPAQAQDPSQTQDSAQTPPDSVPAQDPEPGAAS